MQCCSGLQKQRGVYGYCSQRVPLDMVSTFVEAFLITVIGRALHYRHMNVLSNCPRIEQSGTLTTWRVSKRYLVAMGGITACILIGSFFKLNLGIFQAIQFFLVFLARIACLLLSIVVVNVVWVLVWPGDAGMSFFGYTTLILYRSIASPISKYFDLTNFSPTSVICGHFFCHPRSFARTDLSLFIAIVLLGLLLLNSRHMDALQTTWSWWSIKDWEGWNLSY